MLGNTLQSCLLAFLYVSSAHAAGLYPKGSKVLQVTGRTFDNLVRNADVPTVVEFYAPWCGHCKNLQPAYEKAAQALDGVIQVAAVNCDDDENKSFCGQMGIQGFPTLKTVKPTGTLGKPIIMDYQGERSAGAIVDAAKKLIPSFVKMLTDKDLSSWLAEKNGTAKVLLFSSQKTTGVIAKAVARHFQDNIIFGQVRDTQEEAVAQFGITEFPAFVILPGGTQDAVIYDGEMTKAALVKQLSKYGEPAKRSFTSEAKPKAKKDKSSSKSSASSASSEFVESSASQKSEEAKATNGARIPQPDQQMVAVATPKAIAEMCLNDHASACFVLVIDTRADIGGDMPEELAILQEIYNHNIKTTTTKLKPFVAVPPKTEPNIVLRNALNLDDTISVLIATNGKRNWYKIYTPPATGWDINHMDAWIDSVRQGEGEKHKIPQGLLWELQDKESGRPVGEMPEAAQKVLQDDYESAVVGASSLSESASSVADSVVASGSPIIESVTSQVVESVSSILNAASEGPASVYNDGSEFASSVYDAAAESGSSIYDAAASAVSSGQTGVVSVAADASKSGASAVSAAKKSASSIADKLNSRAADAQKSAESLASEASSSASSLSKSGSAKIADIPVSASVAKAASSASSGAASVVDQASSVLSDQYESASSVAGDVYSNVAEAVGATKSTPVVDDVKSAASKISVSASSAAAEAYNSAASIVGASQSTPIVDAVKGVASKISASAESVVDKVKRVVGDAAEQATQSVKSIIHEDL